jgi:hypothetical protein
VTDALSSGLPAWVSKRDGRREPFEADKISQSLYAASEELGEPSAFLARELTDGVLHFLTAELETDSPSSMQIADVVAKVVRELGHPLLAQKYSERRRHPSQDLPARRQARPAPAVTLEERDTPGTLRDRCMRAYSLHHVFARDAAAAHEEGLIVLAGLERPGEIASKVVEPTDAAAGWLDWLETPARHLVFDGPEYLSLGARASAWVRELAQFCEATGRSAVLNLNAMSPPAWFHSGEHGPLFQAGLGENLGAAEAARQFLVSEIRARASRRLHVSWHLTAQDFAGAKVQGLRMLVQHALAHANFSFTFDRPKQPIGLALGLDRQHGAVLLEVGLSLPRFLREPGIGGDPALLLEKLPSLARMAVRAGVQKRNYLRGRAATRPGLTRGFLIERACLVVTPLGLEQLVQDLLSQGMASSELSLDLGRRIVQSLHDALQLESKSTNLDMVVDGPAGAYPGFRDPIDARHIHAAGQLHGVSGFGTLGCSATNADEIVTLLSLAATQTKVVRVAILDEAPSAP